MRIIPEPCISTDFIDCLDDVDILIGRALTPRFVFIDHKLCKWDNFVSLLNDGTLECEQLQVDISRLAQLRLLMIDNEQSNSETTIEEKSYIRTKKYAKFR